MVEDIIYGMLAAICVVGIGMVLTPRSLKWEDGWSLLDRPDTWPEYKKMIYKPENKNG